MSNPRETKHKTTWLFCIDRAPKTLVFLGAQLHADRTPTDASGVQIRLELGWVLCCLYKRQMDIWYPVPIRQKEQCLSCISRAEALLN